MKDEPLWIHKEEVDYTVEHYQFTVDFFDFLNVSFSYTEFL